MTLNLTVPDEKWGWLLEAAAHEGSDPLKNVQQKVVEYLDACGRDVCASVEAKLAGKLTAMSDVEKAALLATL